jgi:P pilus assembly chaperone PapD
MKPDLHSSADQQWRKLRSRDNLRRNGKSVPRGRLPVLKSMRSLLAFLTAFALPVAASATTVSPVVLDLQTNGRAVVANIAVTNNGVGPLTMETVATPLKPTVTGFVPVEGKNADEDLLVTPPSSLIPAGKTQTFRVQWIGDPELNASRHYYVSINQLPVKMPEGQSAVQIVYNFNVLVSVSSPDHKPQINILSVAPETVQGKPVAAITVQNSGQAHGYLSQRKIKLTEISPAGAELLSKTISGSEFEQLVGYGLVASGQTRTVDIPLDKAPPPGAKLSAVLMDERAQ